MQCEWNPGASELCILILDEHRCLASATKTILIDGVLETDGFQEAGFLSPAKLFLCDPHFGLWFSTHLLDPTSEKYIINSL